ncbi:MAG: aminotransferase class IV [Polaribacter sp.]|nr:aminotransferase class IV [Polaribacter sp.]MDG1993593.1 aminotransferase class IV [Polaribacter sp.]
MLNLNGDLINKNGFFFSANNRAFKYGDAIFETISVLNSKVVFWEDHYFRLMASMRMLRMEIPLQFTLEFLENEILKTVPLELKNKKNRVRLSIYRKDGGLYTPESNEVDFLIEVSEYNYETKKTYKIDLFKDFYNFSGLLSTVKTTNRMINTLASIYMQENDLDNCILLNENKGIVEAANANIFVIKGNEIKTPALQEGCIKGIARKKVIEIIERNENYTITETSISPFEMQKADEVFLTNSLIGIQPVTNYRKKQFQTVIGEKISTNFKLQQIINKD